jgi:lysophospholipase L1-like esterase
MLSLVLDWGVSVPWALAQEGADPQALPSLFTPGARILFQGDSITDGNRGRSLDPNHILGHGYQFIIAARVGSQHPDSHLVFLNRGVSGNTVTDLAKRWQADTLDLKPDILSILIGVNDFTHAGSGRTPGAVEAYERDYDALLASTVAALPRVRLVLGEPFLLPSGSFQEHYAERLAALLPYQAAVARLGTKFHAPVVHYQQMFTAACAKAPADYWIWDGVHPTYAGHGLMADEWMRTVQSAGGPQP